MSNHQKLLNALVGEDSQNQFYRIMLGLCGFEDTSESAVSYVKLQAPKLWQIANKAISDAINTSLTDQEAKDLSDFLDQNKNMIQRITALQNQIHTTTQESMKQIDSKSEAVKEFVKALDDYEQATQP